MKKLILCFILLLVFVACNGGPTADTTVEYDRSIEASLAFSESALDFGEIRVNYTSEKSFTITNSGQFSAKFLKVPSFLEDSPIRYSGEGEEAVFPGAGGTCSTSLPSGESCTINLIFKPMETLSIQQIFSITYSNGVDTLVYNIQMKARSGEAGKLKLSSKNGDWGYMVKGAQERRILTFANEGSLRIFNLKAERVNSFENYFSLDFNVTNPCQNEVKGLATCNVGVTLKAPLVDVPMSDAIKFTFDTATLTDKTSQASLSGYTATLQPLLKYLPIAEEGDVADTSGIVKAIFDDGFKGVEQVKTYRIMNIGENVARNVRACVSKYRCSNISRQEQLKEADYQIDIDPPAGETGLPGLRGEYYFGNFFQNGKALIRVDETIDFHWGAGIKPHTNVPDVNFSVRWTGKIVPRYSETYTFEMQADDGKRLWINDQLLIADWRYTLANTWDAVEGKCYHSDGSESTYVTEASCLANNYSYDTSLKTATIDLVAGQEYDIKIEYMQNTEDAGIQLRWSSASQPLQVVPSSQLRSYTSVAEVADEDFSLATLDPANNPYTIEWVKGDDDNCTVDTSNGVNNGYWTIPMNGTCTLKLTYLPEKVKKEYSPSDYLKVLYNVLDNGTPLVTDAYFDFFIEKVRAYDTGHFELKEGSSNFGQNVFGDLLKRNFEVVFKSSNFLSEATIEELYLSDDAYHDYILALSDAYPPYYWLYQNPEALLSDWYTYNSSQEKESVIGYSAPFYFYDPTNYAPDAPADAAVAPFPIPEDYPGQEINTVSLDPLVTETINWCAAGNVPSDGTKCWCRPGLILRREQTCVMKVFYYPQPENFRTSYASLGIKFKNGAKNPETGDALVVDEFVYASDGRPIVDDYTGELSDKYTEIKPLRLKGIASADPQMAFFNVAKVISAGQKITSTDIIPDVIIGSDVEREKRIYVIGNRGAAPTDGHVTISTGAHEIRGYQPFFLMTVGDCDKIGWAVNSDTKRYEFDATKLVDYMDCVEAAGTAELDPLYEPTLATLKTNYEAIIADESCDDSCKSLQKFIYQQKVFGKAWTSTTADELPWCNLNVSNYINLDGTIKGQLDFVDPIVPLYRPCRVKVIFEPTYNGIFGVNFGLEFSKANPGADKCPLGFPLPESATTEEKLLYKECILPEPEELPINATGKLDTNVIVYRGVEGIFTQTNNGVFDEVVPYELGDTLTMRLQNAANTIDGRFYSMGMQRIRNYAGFKCPDDRTGYEQVETAPGSGVWVDNLSKPLYDKTKKPLAGYAFEDLEPGTCNVYGVGFDYSVLLKSDCHANNNSWDSVESICYDKDNVALTDLTDEATCIESNNVWTPGYCIGNYEYNTKQNCESAGATWVNDTFNPNADYRYAKFLLVGDGDFYFSYTGAGCDTLLSGGAACDLNVSFLPSIGEFPADQDPPDGIVNHKACVIANFRKYNDVRDKRIINLSAQTEALPVLNNLVFSINPKFTGKPRTGDPAGAAGIGEFVYELENVGTQTAYFLAQDKEKMFREIVNASDSPDNIDASTPLSASAIAYLLDVVVTDYAGVETVLCTKEVSKQASATYGDCDANYLASVNSYCGDKIRRNAKCKLRFHFKPQADTDYMYLVHELQYFKRGDCDVPVESEGGPVVDWSAPYGDANACFTSEAGRLSIDDLDNPGFLPPDHFRVVSLSPIQAKTSARAQITVNNLLGDYDQIYSTLQYGDNKIVSYVLKNVGALASNFRYYADYPNDAASSIPSTTGIVLGTNQKYVPDPADPDTFDLTSVGSTYRLWSSNCTTLGDGKTCTVTSLFQPTDVSLTNVFDSSFESQFTVEYQTGIYENITYDPVFAYDPYKDHFNVNLSGTVRMPKAVHRGWDEIYATNTLANDSGGAIKVRLELSEPYLELQKLATGTTSLYSYPDRKITHYQIERSETPNFPLVPAYLKDSSNMVIKIPNQNCAPLGTEECRIFEDPQAGMLLPTKAYFYRFTPFIEATPLDPVVFTGAEVMITPRIVIPPNGMSLIHHLMANREQCGRLYTTTPDPNARYTCSFIGFGGDQYGKIDEENDLFVDIYEASSGNLESKVDEIPYLTTATNYSSFVNGGGDENLCSSRIVTMLATGEDVKKHVLSRKEYMMASVWPADWSDTKIASIETGNSGQACNDFLNQPVEAGSSLECYSRYGISDLVGNAWELLSADGENIIFNKVLMTTPVGDLAAVNENYYDFQNEGTWTGGGEFIGNWGYSAWKCYHPIIGLPETGTVYSSCPTFMKSKTGSVFERSHFSSEVIIADNTVLQQFLLGGGDYLEYTPYLSYQPAEDAIFEPDDALTAQASRSLGSRYTAMWLQFFDSNIKFGYRCSLKIPKGYNSRNPANPTQVIESPTW